MKKIFRILFIVTMIAITILIGITAPMILPTEKYGIACFLISIIGGIFMGSVGFKIDHYLFD